MMFDRLPFVARRRRDREMLRTAFAGDGIEKDLVRVAVEALQVRCIVETGTCTGKTSMWRSALPADHTAPTCAAQRPGRRGTPSTARRSPLKAVPCPGIRVRYSLWGSSAGK
jgi:hypothetical protein